MPGSTSAPPAPGVGGGLGGARTVVPLTGAEGAAAPETNSYAALAAPSGPPPLPAFAINTGVPDLSGLPDEKQSGQLTAATPDTIAVSYGGTWKKMTTYLVTPQVRDKVLHIKPDKRVTVHYKTVHNAELGDMHYATAIEQ